MPHLSRILAALCLTAALTACGVHDPPVTVTAAAPLRHSHPWVDAPEQTSPVAVDAPEERAFATRPSRSEPTTTTTPPKAPVSAPPAPRVAPPPQPRVDAAAAPPPAAQPRASGDGCGGWRYAVEEYDWPPNDVCRVMGCESTYNPTATNGRYKGLMQVDGGSLDGETNLAQAYALWAESRTWRRWSCKP